MKTELSQGYFKFTRSLLFFLSLVIFLLLTIGFILVSEVIFFPAYLNYVLLIGMIGYGLALIIFLMGVKLRKIASKSKGFAKSLSVIATIFLLLIMSMTYIQISEYTHSAPPNFNPRQIPVYVDPTYKFETKFGDLNDTTANMIYWENELPTNPENYAWGESYIERQFVHLYNLTKDETFLEYVIERMDIVVNNSDANHDSIPGYGKTINGYYIEYPVSDGMILFPLIELANIVKNESNQTHYLKLKQKFDYYASLAEKIVQKWNNTNWVEFKNESTGEISGAYLAPPENVQLIFNRNNAMGRLMLELYKYTNNITYRIMTEKIARFFKNHLKIHKYTLPWDSTPKEMYYWAYSVVADSASKFAKIVDNNTFSDVSHAGIDTDFVDMCYRSGIVFDLQDMTRFANTFIDFVYQGRANETNMIQKDLIYPVNFADIVNGGFNGEYYSLQAIRVGWYKMAKYYLNQTEAAFVIFTSIQDTIENEIYNPIHLTLILCTILENIYLNHEFPCGLSFY